MAGLSRLRRTGVPAPPMRLSEHADLPDVETVPGESPIELVSDSAGNVT
jgi:hypothetical protein